MTSHAALRSITCVLSVTWAMSGCSESPGGPSPHPSPQAAPAVTEVVPSTGSVGGGATVKIVGTGFVPGMVAMFDGIRATGRFDTRDTSFSTFYTEAPAHAAGTVDLVVTNPDGRSARLASGYAYAPPQSFDLTGSWGGYSLNGEDTWVEFEIRDSKLVSASCGYDVTTPFAFASFPIVENGAFSFTADGGATMSGRIVSASEVAGDPQLPAVQVWNHAVAGNAEESSLVAFHASMPWLSRSSPAPHSFSDCWPWRLARVSSCEWRGCIS